MFIRLRQKQYLFVDKSLFKIVFGLIKIIGILDLSAFFLYLCFTWFSASKLLLECFFDNIDWPPHQCIDILPYLLSIYLFIQIFNFHHNRVLYYNILIVFNIRKKSNKSKLSKGLFNYKSGAMGKGSLYCCNNSNLVISDSCVVMNARFFYTFKKRIKFIKQTVEYERQKY